MKIRRLKTLTKFRGLQPGFEMLFAHSVRKEQKGIAPLCFVGLNGSGKSNVLEAIAEIFYYLEVYHKVTKDKLEQYKTPFGFEIEYSLPIKAFNLSNIPWPELNQKCEVFKIDPIFLITKQKDNLPTISAIFPDGVLKLQNNDNDRNIAALPQHIIAYSSGMNELLSNPFIKMDFQYYEELSNRKSYVAPTDLNINRLFFLNYESNKFITLSNFLFDASDFDMPSTKATDFGGINLKHIKSILSISELKSFSITLRLNKAKDANDYLPVGLNLALENLKLCATFINEEIKELKTTDQLFIEMVYWVNSETKKAFREYFHRAVDLFRRFYFLNLLNNELVSADLRKEIAGAKAGTYDNLSDELPKFETDKLLFRIHDISFTMKSKHVVHYRKLSDGEHQLLQVFGSLLLMDTDGSLFLMDEPETHFNPDWRSKFIELANNSIDASRSQEIILTTHSPYIVSDCERVNVYVFQKNLDGLVSQPKPPSINTFGTSISILSEEVFGKQDTISDLAKNKIDEIRKMPLDTLTNINAAKEASRVLGESYEKVLLFKELITKETELKK